MFRHKSKKWWLITSTAVVAVLLVAGVVVFSGYFADRAVPGTKVGSTSVAGLTQAQVLEALKQEATAAKVTLKVSDQSKVVNLSELGINIDFDKTAENAVHQGNTFLGRFKGLVKTNQVAPVYTQDSKALSDLTTELEESSGTPVQNAAVELNDEGTAFIAVPGKEGFIISREQMEDAVKRAATELEPFEQRLELEETQPAITTEQAEAVAQQANDIVNLPVSITDGIDVFEASPQDKVQWVAIPTTEEMLGEATVDSTKVTKWVQDLGEKTNVEPGKAVRNLNSRGDVVSVNESASIGWKVNNADEVAKKLLEALSNKEGFEGDFDYDKLEPSEWIENTIPDGTNLVYAAKDGEKWIDIDLSNYTVSAYEGKTIVRGPINMVPGAPQTPTVTGTYKTYLKLPSQTMRGYNVDGTRYETPDVPWPMYFFEDYALHGAYWRSSFGYGGDAGSHGCVNMPVDEAGWLYDWAPLGTTVVSHY